MKPTNLTSGQVFGLLILTGGAKEHGALPYDYTSGHLDPTKRTVSYQVVESLVTRGFAEQRGDRVFVTPAGEVAYAGKKGI